MREAPDNPPTNRLGAGLSEEDLLQAVAASGYPLQTLVAAGLRRDSYGVQEEWSYIDKDSGQMRALDVLAFKSFSQPDAGAPREGEIYSGLTLLIECKQSTMPYVFFLSSSLPVVRDFPLVTGLPKLDLKRENRTWADVPIAYALGLDRWGLIRNATYSTSFTKAHRKGKGLEFSGTDPFNGLVLPLSKALNYYAERNKVQRQPYNCFGKLTVAIGVLDAPMVGVRVTEEETEAYHLPWVRVLKHETRGPEDRFGRDSMVAIDVIHKDFFGAYLKEHLLPFAEAFSILVQKNKKHLIAGQGPAGGDEPRLVLPA